MRWPWRHALHWWLNYRQSTRINEDGFVVGDFWFDLSIAALFPVGVLAVIIDAAFSGR
jgi:hypothetical protein